MTKQKAIAKLLEHRERVRQRPLTYFGKMEPDIARNFLDGFSLSAGVVLGNDQEAHFRNLEKALNQRGWKFVALGVVPQMKKKRFSAEKIIDELIAIEIEYWRQIGIEDSGEIKLPPKKKQR
jgi:hypothetical protein